MSHELPLTLTRADLARHLSVTINHIDTLRRKGRIPPPISSDGLTRWKTADIVEWIDAGMPAMAAAEE